MGPLKKMPYMPLYIGDWLGSRTVSRLSLAAQGLFVRCLLSQWDSGPLAVEPETISADIGNPKDFHEVWPQIEFLFPVCAEGRVNSRLEEHRDDWERVRIEKQISGRKGGRPKANRNQSESGSKPNQNPSDSDSDSLHPTLDQVRKYAVERGAEPEAEKFFDHFSSNGWKVGGKTAMRDWRAAFRNWHRNAIRFNQSGFQRKPDNILREDRSKWTEEQWKNS